MRYRWAKLPGPPIKESTAKEEGEVGKSKTEKTIAEHGEQLRIDNDLDYIYLSSAGWVSGAGVHVLKQTLNLVLIRPLSLR